MFISTGKAGNNPMFFTDSWGSALTNVADNAAGYFIETLNKEWGIDLCHPDLRVKTRITLGLVPPEMVKPDCTFTEMQKNWQTELNDPNFLNRFQTAFKPWSNDLGIALSVHTKAYENRWQKIDVYKEERREGGGFKPVTDTISDVIRTPAKMVARQAEIPLDKSIDGEKVYTGAGIAVDTIDMFLSTLAGNLLDKWFKEGLVRSSPGTGYDWSRITTGDASPSRGGIQAAKERFRSMTEPSFAVRGDYEILRELTKCPKPTRAKTTECVITEKFRQAIAERITVAEAIEQGYLDPGGIFGFKADGLEPSYLEGYPYRSLTILRKYRILPVGWELAAQYINDNSRLTDGIKNLGDLVACFDDSDRFEGYSAAWCRGMVDPHWVLKAPLNYCRREGPGAFIERSSVSGQGENSRLNVIRQSNYCADEQTCIQENPDGSCRLYGYCTEERRKWDFNTPGCNPLYNTCLSFRSRQGDTVSYLQNTLDYGGCGPDDVGCLGYCTAYDSGQGRFTCAGDNHLFLNKNVQECAAASEGCHEFIRMRPGGGVNILREGDFESGLGAWSAFSSAGGTVEAVDTQAYTGRYALRVHHPAAAGNSGARYTVTGISGSEHVSISYQLLSYLNNSGGPTTGPWLRVYARTAAGEALADAAGSPWIAASVPAPGYSGEGRWLTRQFSFVTPPHTRQLVIEALVAGIIGEAFFDSVKVEKGTAATVFSGYGDNGRIYQKVAPDHLNCIGGTGPGACSGFVQYCSENDLGCRLYTAVRDNMTVPARVAAVDYCDQECVGYDSYLQSETVFEFRQPGLFIPASAQKCSAQAAGCDEFTNLDEIGAGAEAREYYAQLRRCASAADPACAQFYTWEGSNEAGYQLKMFRLQADAIGRPATTADVSGRCNADIYRYAPNDPAYDPDCREFYNTAGQTSYRLHSYTITCSDNCHPYRRTRSSVAVDPVNGQNYTAVQCQVRAGTDDYAHIGGECHICKNGGEWRSDHNACIYMAVPGEGRKCAAAQDGCREYSGNTGANTRIISHSSFDGGSLDGWTAQGATGASLNGNALRVGGQMLAVSGAPRAIRLPLGSRVREGNSYTLKFIARGTAGAPTLSAAFGNGTVTAPFAAPAVLSAADWNIYELSIVSVDHSVGAGEYLEIAGSGDYYIDDIRLTEISDRYYVIRDSWQTPAACYLDAYGVPVDEFHNLGCQNYRDQDRGVHALRRFSRLCDESSVGCELMINTHNYSRFGANIWNDGNGNSLCDAGEPDCVRVPADEPVYVVYDSRKSCTMADKGCTLLGRPYHYEAQTLYSRTYLKNDPDKYSAPNGILCAHTGAGCEAWTQAGGTDHFRDPGDQVCEWRAGQGQGGSELFQGWFRKPVKRCDADGNGSINVGPGPAFLPVAAESGVCLSAGDCALAGPANCAGDADCGANRTCVSGRCRAACIEDRNDHACGTDHFKTLGLGGSGNRVPQPSGTVFAGQCPASESTCTEYIDPVSRFGNNLIFNSDFRQDMDGDGDADGWYANSQPVNIRPYTLYVLALESSAAFTLSIVSPSPAFRILDRNNTLGADTDTVALASGGGRVSRVFYTNGSAASARISVSSAAANTPAAVELKPAALAYQLSGKIDAAGCSGLANFEDGCILFNERAQNGAVLNPSNWDADLTYDDGRGMSPLSNPVLAENNANRLVKVSPNRDCREWLACRSFIKDEQDNNVCFDLAACDSVNQNGECDSFIIKERTELAYIAADQARFADLSGYVRSGYRPNSLTYDHYPLSTMEQSGNYTGVPNGNFELYGENGYPVGWTHDALIWDANAFRVVNNPVEIQSECLNTNCALYVPEGRSFLKTGSSFGATSEFIDVDEGRQYVLTAYMNTMNLKEGQAGIEIQEYNAGGDPIATSSMLLSLDGGHGWTLQMSSFNVSPSTRRVKMRLMSAPESVGNFYYDDIRLSPALHYRADQYANQTCRLYPETDAMSCNYFDDSGIINRGWPGYCLEYDRYPGDENSCLLWWPVDKVKGDGIEEGAGYQGKVPVYYCVDACRADGTGGSCAGIEMQSCQDIQDLYPSSPSGYYTIDPGSGPLNVYCDMETDGGGWTIIDYSLDSNWRDHFGNWNFYSHSGSNIAAGANNNCLTWRNWFQLVGNAANRQSFDFRASPDCRNINLTPGVYIASGNYFGCRWYNRNCDFDGACNACLDNHPPNPQTPGTCPFIYYTVDGLIGYVPPPGTDYADMSYCASCGSDWWNYTPSIGVDGNHCMAYRNRLPLECGNIVQTVTSSGDNKYWAGRVYEGSDYLTVRGVAYADYSAPFGSISPPGDSFSSLTNPYEWYVIDEGSGLRRPLHSRSQGSGVSMGYIHERDSVMRLFAQSYNFWNWNAATSRYEPATTENWLPPQTLCPGVSRPAYDPANPLADYCAIRPRIETANIRANGSAGFVRIHNNGYILFTFNSNVNSEQLPLVMYTVRWGDDETTIVSGVEMRDRPSQSNPHAMYHLYNYWDLLAKSRQTDPEVVCADAGALVVPGYNCPVACCAVRPSVKIRDNWGWCNNGVNNNPCPISGADEFINYPGWIIVSEN